MLCFAFELSHYLWLGGMLICTTQAENHTGNCPAIDCGVYIGTGHFRTRVSELALNTCRGPSANLRMHEWKRFALLKNILQINDQSICAVKGSDSCSP